MKTESINFRDFLADDYRKVKMFGRDTLLMSSSAITYVSFERIFNPPPLITQGYLIMFGVGFVLITAALLEKHFAKNEFTQIATSIFNFIKTVMPFALIAALILFVLKNPLI